MALSIVVPVPPDLSYDHRDGHSGSTFGDSPTFPDNISNTSATSSEGGESLSGWPSSHSRRSNPLRKPVSTASRLRQPGPSRKSSTSSLPIYNRRSPVTPPVVRWCPSPDSPTTSSSTLFESSQEDNESLGDAVETELRAHLQTFLDENKLANRSITMDGAVSHCATLKGFQDHSTFQSDASFQQLLTLATMLDFALEEPNHDGLYQIVQGLVRGVDEFLERLERLPFDLRRMPSFISGISDILQAKSALLGVAGQLNAQADATTSCQVVKSCQYERDRLLRAIRVLFDIADFESRLQAKLSIKRSSFSIP